MDRGSRIATRTRSAETCLLFAVWCLVDHHTSDQARPTKCKSKSRLGPVAYGRPVGLCPEVWPQIELLLINNSETPLSGPHSQLPTPRPQSPLLPQTGAPNLGWRPNVDALFWLGFGCELLAASLLACTFGHKVQLAKHSQSRKFYRHLSPRLICGITRFVIENYIRFVTSACNRTSSTSSYYWVICQHRKENKKDGSWAVSKNLIPCTSMHIKINCLHNYWLHVYIYTRESAVLGIICCYRSI